TMRRFYAGDVTPTLFGEWQLVWEWGRIGQGGTLRTCTYPAQDETEKAQARSISASCGVDMGSRPWLLLIQLCQCHPMTMGIDTLKVPEDLKKAVFPEPQARALADKFGELANDRLVTREYLDFKLNELDAKLKELRYSLILSLGGIMTAIIGFFK